MFKKLKSSVSYISCLNDEQILHIDQTCWNNLYIEACSVGNLAFVKFLLNETRLAHFIDIHANNDDAALLACEHGHLDVVQYLLSDLSLKEHIAINTRKNRLIKCACLTNNVEMAQLLFKLNTTTKEKIDIHATNDFSFIWAFKMGHVHIVQYLLENKELKNSQVLFDIHMQKDLLFKTAVTHHHTELIKYLILEYYIPKTTYISQYLESEKYDACDYAQKLFNSRCLYEQLHEQFNTKQQLSKDITKI